MRVFSSLSQNIFVETVPSDFNSAKKSVRDHTNFKTFNVDFFVEKTHLFKSTVVNIINVFCTRFLYKSLFCSFFLVTFWQKKHTCSQYHQHFTSSFCTNILVQKNYKGKLEKLEKSFAKHFCMKKARVKC
jgi:hypothetical protein